MKSNYIEYEKVKAEAEILLKQHLELVRKINDKRTEMKRLLKKCIENKEITIDTLFKLI